MLAALALILIFIISSVTTITCIAITHRHNQRMAEMAHRQRIQKDEHNLMMDKERKSLELERRQTQEWRILTRGKIPRGRNQESVFLGGISQQVIKRPSV